MDGLQAQRAATSHKDHAFTVVIDPGHGGKDPGAVGKKVKEKDIVLAIALKLGSYIEKNMPDVKIIYTRKTDEFIELYKRAQIANENKADLFVSIHCNASPSAVAYGTETFVMGLHRSQANLEVAKKENAAILLEENYIDKYDGFDPNSPEANVIFSLFQNAFLDQSLTLASQVQYQFRERAKRVDRGVKQAGFLVLYRITMPGILVEAGFLSNPKEEEFLASESGQDYIASSLFRAFRDYKEQHDESFNGKPQVTAEPASSTPSSKPEVVETKPAPTQNPKPQEKPKEKDKPQTPAARNPQAVQSTPNQGEVFFKVQFATTSVKKELNAPEFSGLEEVDFYFQDGLFKYTVGKVKSLEDATLIQGEVQKKGFKDAFVVAFLDDKRISPSEAIKILNSRKTPLNP